MSTERQAERIGRLIDAGFEKGVDPGCLEASRAAVLQTMTEMENGRRLPVRSMVAAAALLFAFGGALLWSRLSEPRVFSYRVAGAAASVAPGEWIRTGEREATSVVFDNGSRFVLTRGTVARVTASDADQVRLELTHGKVTADVTGNGHTAWCIDAGPYTVRVLGTRFTTAWREDADQLAVSVRSGRVAVSGDGIPDGVVVTAGQRLVAEASAVRIDNTAVTASKTPTAASEPALRRDGIAAAIPAQSPVEGVTEPESEDGGTAVPVRRRADRSEEVADNDALVDSAAHASVGNDLNTLWHQAESARRRGEIAAAERLFIEIRARFPGTHRAATAAFLLGTAAVDAHGNSAAAEQWFSRYLSEAPRGDLAEEALGRRMEALWVLGKRAAAAAIAKTYLVRYPKGSFAGTAVQITGEP